MSHRHFCDFAGHWWVCEGMASRAIAGHPEPVVCMCREHGVPMEVGDHSKCRVELLACPEHQRAQFRAMQAAQAEFERRKAEFGLDEKFAAMQAMEDGPDKDAAAQAILDWVLENS